MSIKVKVESGQVFIVVVDDKASGRNNLEPTDRNNLVFVPRKPFQPSLIFGSGAYTIVEHPRGASLGYTPALSTNITWLHRGKLLHIRKSQM